MLQVADYLLPHMCKSSRHKNSMEMHFGQISRTLYENTCNPQKLSQEDVQYITLENIKASIH